MRTGSVHACFFFNWDFIAGGEAFADDDDALLDKKDLDDNDDEHEHYDDDYGVDKLWNSVNITGCASFVLACFCFVFVVYVPSSLCNIFFFIRSFFLFFLSLLSLFLRLLLIPPSHQIQSTPQGIVNRSSDSHTHIRKINSHSRLLKVKISSLGVLLGDCRVLGFATSVVGSHCSLLIRSLLAQCRLHHSISPQSVIGGDMNRAVPLQPHRTTRLVLAGPLLK